MQWTLIVSTRFVDDKPQRTYKNQTLSDCKITSRYILSQSIRMYWTILLVLVPERSYHAQCSSHSPPRRTCQSWSQKPGWARQNLSWPQAGRVLAGKCGCPLGHQSYFDGLYVQNGFAILPVQMSLGQLLLCLFRKKPLITCHIALQRSRTSRKFFSYLSLRTRWTWTYTWYIHSIS